MRASPPAEGPRRLADEAPDEIVTSGLLALRADAPSDRSRQNLLAELGLHVSAVTPAVRVEAARSLWQTVRRLAPALSLGIGLGLAWALYRRYAH